MTCPFPIAPQLLYFDVNYQMLSESSPQELGMLKRERSERLTS